MEDLAGPGPVKQGGRDTTTGRFRPGVSGNPNGRPKGRRVTDVLRETVDPEEMSKLLLDIARHPGHDQLKAIEYVMNRLDGSPRQTLAVEQQEHPGLEFARQLYSWMHNEDAPLPQAVREMSATPEERPH